MLINISTKKLTLYICTDRSVSLYLHSQNKLLYKLNQKHNREEVLKKGLAMLCNKGYNSLGVDEICKVTGMTKGAFYNAFKSKEQFLKDAISFYSENNINRIKLQLQPTEKHSAFERLQLFYTKMLEVQPKVNFTGCFINNIMSEMGFTSEIIGSVSNIEFYKFIDAIEPTIVEAQMNGEITSDINSRQIAELIHSTFYGVLTIAKSSHNYKQSILTINLLIQNLKTKKNGKNNHY
jgi:TetR/AcrR family transcriptional repressor of nem operon